MQQHNLPITDPTYIPYPLTLPGQTLRICIVCMANATKQERSGPLSSEWRLGK